MSIEIIKRELEKIQIHDFNISCRLKTVEHLLKKFVDLCDDECRGDHRGYCQSHFLHPIDECPVKLAKEYFNINKD